MVTTVQSLSPLDLPSVKDLDAACGPDTLCAARILSKIIGPKALLRKVRHPSSDRIRMVTSVRSVENFHVDGQGILYVKLNRFGRKVISEMRKLVGTISVIKQIRLDLRENPGGDVDRMLRVTALFTGGVKNAVFLMGRNGKKILSIPDKTPLFKNLPLQVLIGPKTISSGEILAALLKIHANAQLLGDKTFGKDYLLRVVPVSHDWRLLVPAERVVVPGSQLTGGLIPDGSFPQ